MSVRPSQVKVSGGGRYQGQTGARAGAGAGGSGLGQGQLEQWNYGEGGEVSQDRLHAAHAVDPHQVLLPEAEDGGSQEWEDLH